MYSIRKFADCWAVFNLDRQDPKGHRELTEEEVEIIKKKIPELIDPMTVAHYTDQIECLEKLP